MYYNDGRTYRRRQATRKSGYETGEKTGGECIIAYAQKFTQHKDKIKFRFYRNEIILTELFDKNIGILAFGGYLFTEEDIDIRFSLKYTLNGMEFSHKQDFMSPINIKEWTGIGFHKEINLDYGDLLSDVSIKMTIDGTIGNNLEFIGFDFDAISKGELTDDKLANSFYQKTSMHIPYLYYLNAEFRFDKYAEKELPLRTGKLMILKSCNRCGRFLPINIFNEMNTLGFSLHCKKRAPCTHSTFRAYTIENDIPYWDMDNLNILQNVLQMESRKIISYYGHQLECKSCKKFFVNAPLNPQRNAQQFKEDGLRRRALEPLINYLLETNFVHFEFEKQTKKEFSEHIWKKFGERCFKCKKLIPLDEMHLDHTMPLSYLYRLNETATCLCSTHNAEKSDKFPIDYYSEEELKRLSSITGLTFEQLNYRGINLEVLELLVANVVWYFDKFLMLPEYQKVRDGIRTADKINDSLKRVIAGRVNLIEEYEKIIGYYPSSITIIH